MNPFQCHEVVGAYPSYCWVMHFEQVSTHIGRHQLTYEARLREDENSTQEKPSWDLNQDLQAVRRGC